MEKSYKGIETQSTTLCQLQENGLWKVTQKVKHRRSIDLIDWEEKELEMSAYNKEIEKAVATVFLSVEAYLATRENDLFGEPNKLQDGSFVS